MACGRECAARFGATGANADAHGVDYNAAQIDNECREPAAVFANAIASEIGCSMAPPGYPVPVAASSSASAMSTATTREIPGSGIVMPTS